MTDKRNPPDNSAFAYCLRILVPCALGTFVLIGATTYILFTYGFSKGAIQANVGFVLLFMINIELLCPFLLVRQLVKPLQILNRASEKVTMGDFDVSLDYKGKITELETVFHNFKTMTEELSSIETLRSDFVSNVSHEFKTPLTAIEGYATLMQNPDISESEKEEYIDRILYNTKRLSSLVGNILMLSKLNNQTIQPEIRTYRLDEQILQILLQQEAVWCAKGIEFDLDMKEITYTGAEQLLYHVWSNLISNAVKFSHQNGIIRISLYKKGPRIVFEIADQGIGISEQNLRHVFEKFYQADTSHKKEGNGLGLAQVKKIIELTGNQITAASENGKGSIFTVQLFE
ncbi:HAMP domain-containing sensor histidine kinase [Anaerobium acetethylicum]|uniref:histidine kinase n=1 Tax=Anaerobium acetethylicum TaxID=1619234 RepID=A0A1D3TNC9_9FIRM|nr:HAMP domain-containing sensor histidine kinase [Anaerobium acetethylicum]SCP94837.1 Signal transduction histidine kinase [Anaerobium acetethylicum]